MSTVTFTDMDISEDFPPPSVAFVVHEIVTSHGDALGSWAWCKLRPDGEAGYAEVSCTYDDGVTKTDWPSGAKLGPVVVKVWC